MNQSSKLKIGQLEKLQVSQPFSLSSKSANKILLNLLLNVKGDILETSTNVVHFNEGDVVFREGDEAEACFLIQNGRVAVVMGDLDAPTAVLHRGPGDIIGEMALLEKRPRSASIVALEAVQMMRIEQDNFDDLLEVDPVVTKNLLSMLSYRLRNAHHLNKSNVQKQSFLSEKLASLEEKNEILEEMERVRQETIDLIVHDLRNPLANLFGVIRIFENTLPDDYLKTHHEVMSIAQRAYSRMARMVDSLLDMRSMESGEYELELTAVKVQEIIEETLQLSSFIIEKRLIQVVTHLPDKPVLVLVEEDMMYRVMANLVDNALKHIPEKGKLTISLDVFESYCQVSVMDNGVGIPPEDRSTIFEPYRQINRSGKRQRGYGLGLTFVSRAVDAHNGRVWVESGDDGIGSKFVFTLPI
jgi:signal transduction histidine kinase